MLLIKKNAMKSRKQSLIIQENIVSSIEHCIQNLSELFKNSLYHLKFKGIVVVA